MYYEPIIQSIIMNVECIKHTNLNQEIQPLTSLGSFRMLSQFTREHAQWTQREFHDDEYKANASPQRTTVAKDNQEVTGTPTDRALFKWVIQLEKDMNSTYSRSNSKIIKGPCNKKGFSKAKYPSLESKGIVRAHGIALDSDMALRFIGRAKLNLFWINAHCINCL
ncbi:hypothetical protein YC2023_047423 [Brassica napus]